MSNKVEKNAIDVENHILPTSTTSTSVFFLETDQNFKLPFAMYLNDPSLKISVPAAGIPEQFFNFTTRVNDMGKQFTESRLSYGAVGSVAHPSSPMDLTIEFATNVQLPGGTTIRLTLPGTKYDYTRIYLLFYLFVVLLFLQIINHYMAG